MYQKMYYDDSVLIESNQSSPITSTDTGSNWSRPTKKKQKRMWKVAKIPKRTRSSFAKKTVGENRSEDNGLTTKSSHLRLRRYCLKMRKPAHLNIKQTKALIEKINDQSRIVHYLWPRCQKQTTNLEAEVARLQQRLNELQVEQIEIKRKCWCRVCQKEATYVHDKRFYCSKECERKYGILQQQK